ncbi:MAG TPA: asparagine synthase (glutamine-hydrolyzing) [Nostocaceae cyanobacterium]|nr:asparagine synthase (glutamine-hydrolyzing) [Nostocaceae cyanobacterium]
MCGINGFLDISRQTSPDKMRFMIQKMTNTLVHRGPDDAGIWTDAENGIALGHRRLAVMDVSPQGHQPMISANGRYIIIYNGEIYNFWELRKELEKLGHSFRGHCDTEIMLASFCQWGLHRAIQKFNGMFAFALWDNYTKLLYLGRDHLGEKPLYYGWMDNFFLFASELKSLTSHPAFTKEINRDALTLFLRFNYIPAPYSIYQGIYKLLPGTILSSNHPRPVAYWSAKEMAEFGVFQPVVDSEAEIIAQVEELLIDAIKLRMVADVPVGAFLSGGVDSSTIVALMQAHSNKPVKTFSISFRQDIEKEVQCPQAIAEYLGCQHTQIDVTPLEAIAIIPQLPTLYDEPFADVTQIPTFLVSQLARKQVTVGLFSDGGNELFGGYHRYVWGQRIWQQIGWITPQFRQILASVFTSLSPQTWDILFSLLPQKFRPTNPGDKVYKLAEILAATHPETTYKNLMSYWKHPETIVLGGLEAATIFSTPRFWANLPDFAQRMMYLDAVTYLPDNILVKLDRASMGVGLESRLPFLDYRLVELAWRIPVAMKIRNGQGKWLLRQILYKYVPPNLIKRSNSGFNLPLDSLLRQPLRTWAEGLLDPQRLKQEGFFQPQPIVEKWQEHLSGDRNWSSELWSILMFQAWLEQNQ